MAVYSASTDTCDESNLHVEVPLQFQSSLRYTYMYNNLVKKQRD